MEAAVFRTVADNVRSQRAANAGDVGQQLAAGGVQFHPDSIHAGGDGLVQRCRQFFLIDIMLVLPHPDGLRIDLYQFSKRIHKPAAY